MPELDDCRAGGAIARLAAASEPDDGGYLCHRVRNLDLGRRATWLDAERRMKTLQIVAIWSVATAAVVLLANFIGPGGL